MSLLKKYKNISKIKDKDIKTYSTVKISRYSKHLLGVNGENKVAILFSATKPKGKKENIKYLNLDHDVPCNIYINNKKRKENLSILKCDSESENLKEIFLRSIDNFAYSASNDISQKEIYEMTKNLIELFEKITQNRNNDLIGFWGELFIINYLKSKEKLLEAWHPDKKDTFDFLINNYALEIKTSSSNNRIHNFSYEQLNSKNTSIIIGSVMIRKSRSGMSLLDLKNNILKKINQEQLKIKLQEMYDIMTGTKTKYELEDVKYTYEYAKDHTKFFNSKMVPRIKENLMPGIKHVKFQSNLNGVKSINNFSKYKFLK
jgi:hypothetical protein